MADFLPSLGYVPIVIEPRIRPERSAKLGCQLGQVEELLEIVRPAFRQLVEILFVLEDDPGIIDEPEYSRFQCTFQGVAGHVVSAGPLAPGEQDVGIAHALPRKPLQLQPVHQSGSPPRPTLYSTRDRPLGHPAASSS
jgi:hypothetical protein